MSHELSDLLRDAEELDTGVIDHCVKLALKLEAALEASREALAEAERQREVARGLVRLTYAKWSPELADACKKAVDKWDAEGRAAPPGEPPA